MLLDKLRHEREYPMEYAILACARIDAVAHLARSGDSRRRFVEFVSSYGELRGTMGLVSVPDLHSALLGYALIVPAMIESPGRIREFSPEDRRFVDLIWNSKLPILPQAIEEFLAFVLGELERSYRVRPRQPKRKASLASVSEIQHRLEERAATYRGGLFAEAVGAVLALMRDFVLGNILHREVRSASIHEHSFFLDAKRFYAEPDLYWESFTRDPLMEAPAGLSVRFSAAFLMELLSGTTEAYKAELMARRRVPLAMFLDWFDVMTEAAYIDSDSVPTARGILLARGR